MRSQPVSLVYVNRGTPEMTRCLIVKLNSFRDETLRAAGTDLVSHYFVNAHNVFKKLPLSTKPIWLFASLIVCDFWPHGLNRKPQNAFASGPSHQRGAANSNITWKCLFVHSFCCHAACIPCCCISRGSCGLLICYSVSDLNIMTCIKVS